MISSPERSCTTFVCLPPTASPCPTSFYARLSLLSCCSGFSISPCTLSNSILCGVWDPITSQCHHFLPSKSLHLTQTQPNRAIFVCSLSCCMEFSVSHPTTTNTRPDLQKQSNMAHLSHGSQTNSTLDSCIWSTHPSLQTYDTSALLLPSPSTNPKGSRSCPD